MRKSDDCAQAAREFIAVADGIDIVIANSGIGGNDKLLSGNSKQINNILTTNLLGVTNTIFPFIPTLIQQQSMAAMLDQKWQCAVYLILGVSL